MLCSLHIRDFVIVDRLDLEFGAGFTVLTGETGAGKSLLIDALSLVLGERSDTSWVREGAERAEISAVFDVSGNAGLRAELAGRDLLEDDQVILRRVLERAGRSRAYLNGAPATLAQLKEVGEYLVDIHGQHLHQSLMRPAAQRDLLDGFAQAMPLRELVRQAHARWQSLQRTLADFERNATGLAREREALQDQVAELARLKLAPNEWEALETEHRRLANAASLIHGADEALQLLSEGEVNVLSTLRTLLARLRHDAETDGTLVPSAELVEAGQIQLQEAAH
ncbi:MAG: DNA repair protein RecN, partial [Betaproteobacteria bacterium]|nr:DNA repair protein RecN [Betaproteobacteria bacterium]